jgi:hypothetical protein
VVSHKEGSVSVDWEAENNAKWWMENSMAWAKRAREAEKELAECRKQRDDLKIALDKEFE